AIESVYPNPFNPTTTALVSVRDLGNYDVRVYNVLGQLVEERTIEVQTRGQIEVGFDFAQRASGLYLIQMEHKATGKTVTARAMLLK
ncbi:MAG TPA: T9SS type A sorting domain-containing protein, partial [Rhodothermales bacterium]